MIRIVEKPDTISWDEIADVQYRAHERNRANGVDMNCAHLNGEVFKQKMGDGRCFVAMDDDKVVGITCYAIRKNYNSYWFCNNNTVAETMFTGILPDYQGGNTYLRLLMTRDAQAKKDGAEILITDTHYKNENMRKIFKAYGFKEMLWTVYYGCKYYSVVYAKWTGKCPYTEEEIAKRLEKSEETTKRQYDENGHIHLIYRVINKIKRTLKL